MVSESATSRRAACTPAVSQRSTARSSRLTLALVGGDGRVDLAPLGAADVRVFGSSRYSGNGDGHRVLAAIASGSIDAVILLVRWLGHPASQQIRAACRKSAVPCHFVVGGGSAAAVLIRALADKGNR